MIRKTLLLLTAAIGLTMNADAGTMVQINEPVLVAWTKDNCKKINELLDEEDQEALMEMVSEGSAVLLRTGTVIDVVDMGMWDSIDRIHLRGIPRDLYVSDHIKSYYTDRKAAIDRDGALADEALAEPTPTPTPKHHSNPNWDWQRKIQLHKEAWPVASTSDEEYQKLLKQAGLK